MQFSEKCDKVFKENTNVYEWRITMTEGQYFIVESSVLPEIIEKVIEAKKLLESGEVKTINDAVKTIGISRSAFYKYKDSVFPFYENSRGKTMTISVTLEDKSGVLSHMLNSIAETGANILTINQNIPINGVANATITIETGAMNTDIKGLLDHMERTAGVRKIGILARE